MDHLGDITKICGYDAPPVDVVIGGSPCQDLSVAGKREGLAGGRSGLFMEQIRIIKELRDADKRRGRTGEFVRPRFMVWENVEGALSSPGGKKRGADFGAVLEEIVWVAEPDAPPVPVPEKGWPRAGCLHGMEGEWSLAWRVLDGRYWGPTQEADGRVLHLGTPQRRRRIALVADFGGGSAPEILFERQGVSGHPEPGGEAWEETGTDTGAGTAGADPVDGEGCLRDLILDDQGGQRITVYNDGVAPTIRAEMHGNVPCVIEPGELIAFAQNQRDEVRDLGGVAGALAAEPGMKQQTYVAQPMAIAFGAKQQSMAASDEVAATLGANDYKEPQVVVTHGFSYKAGSDAGSIGLEAECAPTLLGSRHDAAVTYDARGNGGGEVCATMTDDHESRVTDYTNLVVRKAWGIGNGQANCAARPAEEVSMTIDCMHDAQAVMTENGRCEFVVRRLTPLECERLQGYPDFWTQLPVIETMTREEFDFWDCVRREWAAVEGKRYTTPKTVETMIKWWNKMATSDSHRYKALGNSICLPGWKWICKRISAQYERDATMGSLFDGIGGFPYIWQQLNGPGTCLWASEVEPFQIAVTRLRIGS